MASLIDIVKPEPYYKKSVFGDYTQWRKDLSESVWVYIGNLSFYTTENQVSYYQWK